MVKALLEITSSQCRKIVVMVKQLISIVHLLLPHPRDMRTLQPAEMVVVGIARRLMAIKHTRNIRSDSKFLFYEDDGKGHNYDGMIIFNYIVMYMYTLSLFMLLYMYVYYILIMPYVVYGMRFLEHFDKKNN